MLPMLSAAYAGIGSRLAKCNSTIINSIRCTSSFDINNLKVGDIIHGYKLEQTEYIKELNVKPYYLKHQATGAEHLHVHKEGDSNNVFSVSFRTTPKDSTGVAHILEHLALCGSKKYAVRDPFMKMLTRSLATFMNAMTGPDFTAYPFSTQNAKDFENLLNVYIDAVFFPRLRPVDFRQEGWRLEHEKPDKKDTPIIIRGVVYNEMKGALTSSSQIYGRHLMSHLFPDTTYHHESGGDPQVIPSLTHDDLKKFHRLHYHPSNAKFFTYGNLPLDNHLRLINELALSKFSENSQARERSIVTEQELWSTPRTADITCPPDPLTADPEKQTTTSISYLLPTKNTNHEDMYALQILSSLMLDGPNAPFFKSLIEPGLGSDYSPSSGLINMTKQPYFSVGLQNIKDNDVSRVHEIIENTFKETAATGFPQDRIDAILHNIELGLKHVSGNFGLRVLMSLECSWNHDGDVVDSFRVNKYVEMFKKDIASDKDYWNKLIHRFFLSNNHKLILNMRPDKSYEENQKEIEKNLIESKVSHLKEVDLQTVLYEGMELMKIQDTKDDLTILPCLEPAQDISKELTLKTELNFDTHKNVKIQLSEQPTNEVVYFRALSDVGDKIKAAKLLDYLPLFCDVATKLGAGAYNKNELSLKSQLTTGGLGVSMLINPSLTEFDKFKNEVLISSHCLNRNVSHMFNLWLNVFKEIHFSSNKDYLLQLIKAAASDLTEGIPFRGNTYAIKKSAASLSDITALDEKLSGLTYVARVKDMASKESIDSIAKKLQVIASIVMDPHNIRCAINAEPDSMERTTDELKKFIDSAQGITSGRVGHEVPLYTDEEYAVTNVEEMKFPFPTHYVARSMITVPRLHEDFAKLVIMSKLISLKYFLREIREKGGAYGASASVSNAGILSMSSYRDPNTDKTIKTFSHAVRWLAEGTEFDERDIEECKLGVFRDVDKPVAPGGRGLNHFFYGETDAMRQEYRRRLLEVTRDDVVAVGQKYLTQTTFGTHVI